MALPYLNIIESEPFRFLIGPAKKAFIIHSALVSHQSTALDTLVSGNMSEAQQGYAELKNVEEETFVRCSQYFYTGDYHPAESLMISETCSTAYEPDHFVPATNLPIGAEEDRRSTFSSKKKKTNIKVRKPVRESDLEPEPVTWTKTAKQLILWTSFQQRNYGEVPEFQPKENAQPCEEFTDVFLGHAKVYVFAEMYDIQALRNIALDKLWRSLTVFNLFDKRISDVLDLLQYVYHNTAERKGAQDGLRALVVQYVACHVEQFVPKEAFQEILKREGDIAADLMLQLIHRLD